MLSLHLHEYSGGLFARAFSTKPLEEMFHIYHMLQTAKSRPLRRAAIVRTSGLCSQNVADNVATGKPPQRYLSDPDMGSVSESCFNSVKTGTVRSCFHSPL